MKTVAVFFDNPGFDDYPFDKEEYRTAYHELGGIVEKQGGRFCIARAQETFEGKGRFSKGWEFAAGAYRPCGAFTADLVYDKGYFVSDGATEVLNDRALDVICTDKWRTYMLFPQLSAPTFRVEDDAQLRSALAQIGSGPAVAKPLDGEEGEGVLIGTAEELGRQVTSFPYLIQSFIDTSGGIPGLIDGIHDFRVISVSGNPVLAYIRTPPPGRKLANVAQGGKEIHVPLQKVPEGALDICRAVDREFARFPKRVYSVDMGRDTDGRWNIIEINSKPGLTPMRFGPDYVRYLHLLAATLLS
jgi:glutathione synthase/RimK-type ligase-like ATP-grasp enzyme